MRRRRSLIHPLLVVLALSTGSLAAGCENVFLDLETIEFQSGLDGGDADADGGGGLTDGGDPADGGDVGPILPDGGDVGPDPDAGDGGDTDDAGDTGDTGDTGTDPTGPVCMRSFPVNTHCDPVKDTGCPSQAPNCDIVISGGMPGVGCSTNVAGDGVAGDICQSGSDCGLGMTCVSWGSEIDPRSRVCTAFCELETGYGCGPGQFCTRATALIAVNMPGIGFCADRCDPYDPEACALGQTCSTDYHYDADIDSTHTCLPEFRCVLSPGSGTPEGGACTVDSSSGMCARGLTCLEGTCVKPCQDDADCGGGTCGAPATDFALRYCQ